MKLFTKGQALVEVILALTIGALLIGAAATAMALMLRQSGDIKSTQVAVGLAQEYLDRIEEIARQDWNELYNATSSAFKGPATRFHLTTTSSPDGVEISSRENGLVGLWHLNGTLGPIANGANIPAATGTAGTASNVNGSGMAYQIGELNQAINFDGVDDYINIGNPAELQITSAITLEAWVRPDETAAFHQIISKASSSDIPNRAYSLRVHLNKALFTILQGNVEQQVFSSSTLSANVWTHLVGTYDGTTQKVYVNGVEDASTTRTGPIDTDPGPLLLGRLATSGTPELFDGAIDEVAVYNTALSAATIHTHYLDGLRPKFIVAPGASTTVIAGQTFTRYFSIENVNRTACGVGNITSAAITTCSSLPASWPGGAGDILEDPSTQKVTVTVEWQGGGTLSVARYLTRTGNFVLNQTDWSGGTGQEYFSTSTQGTFVNNKIASTTNMDYASAVGSLEIQPTGSGTSTWTLLSADTGAAGFPPRREDQASAWDSTNNRLLIYGGELPYLGDLWSWDAINGWQPLPSAPVTHSGAAADWDTQVNRFLTFGGTSNTNDLRSWEDTNGWQLITDNVGPSDRNFHNGAWDPQAKRLLIFGGGVDSEYRNDLWCFNAVANACGAGQAVNTWTLLTANGAAGSPPGREDSAVAWDSQSNRLLVFGGLASSSPYIPLNDLWAWDSTNGWGTGPLTDNTGPSDREDVEADWDRQNNRLLMLGGIASTTRYNDLRAWNPGTNSWTELVANNPSDPPGRPVRRDDHTVVWDSSANQLLIFGGGTGTAQLNDLWAFSEVPTIASSATITSSVFDTQTIGGATINSVIWQGAPKGGEVKFQLASSVTSTGPWNFIGPDGTISTFYFPNPNGSDIPIPINPLYHRNHRYFRYKVTLERSGSGNSPRVDLISINYSP